MLQPSTTFFAVWRSFLRTINPARASSAISRRTMAGVTLERVETMLGVSTAFGFRRKRRMILTRAGELNIAPRVSMDMPEVYGIAPGVATSKKSPQLRGFFASKGIT